MKKKNHFRALPLCFFLLTAVLTAAFFLLPKQSFAENEKRVLAEPPRWSREALLDGTLTEQAQTYIADHFPLREAFVGLHAYADQLFGMNGDSGVYRGKDGFLFTAQGEVSLSKTAENVKKIRDFAARSQLKTTWMLVPCSGAVLGEKLPRFHKTFRDGEILDAAKAAAEGDAFLDVRSAFSGSDTAQLYYKTDHHLTSRGSRLLYETYCAANGLAPQSFTLTQTSEGFYGTAYSKSGLWLTKPDEVEIFAEDGGDYSVTITEGSEETTYDSLYFPEHLKARDQYPVFLDGNHSLVRIDNNRCNNGKKLLILKDSFAHCFTTFLAANYETILMVDLRYFRSPLSELIAEEGIRDLLVLYGAENLATSTDIAWLTMM